MDFQPIFSESDRTSVTRDSTKIMLYLDRKYDPAWWSSKLGDAELNFSIWNFSKGQEIWERVPNWEMAVKILVWLPIAVIGFVSNFTIILVMIRVKFIRTCTNYFFLNMAAADLITILISSWSILIIDFFQNYVLGPFFCRAEGAIQVTFLLSSVFSLVAISCDRLLAVTFPLLPRLNKKRALILIILIWLTSLTISLPTVFNRSWHTRQWADYLEIFCAEDRRMKYYWFTILVLLCYLPLTVMTVAYSVIIIQLDKFEHHLSFKQHPLKKKYRRKVLKMLFIYLVNFMWCWVLFQVVVLYRYFKTPGEYELPKWYKPVYFCAHLLSYGHSTINPIVYISSNENFRKATKLTFPCIFRTNRINPNMIQVQQLPEPANCNGAQDNNAN